MRPSQRSHSIRPAASRRNSTRSPLRGPVSTAARRRPVNDRRGRRKRNRLAGRGSIDETRRRRAGHAQLRAVARQTSQMFERGVIRRLRTRPRSGERPFASCGARFAEAEEQPLAAVGDRLARLAAGVGIRQHRHRKSLRRNHLERRQHAGDRAAVFDEPMPAAGVDRASTKMPIDSHMLPAGACIALHLAPSVRDCSTRRPSTAPTCSAA